ncbi:hypothetical protein Pse7367_1226 [Thalassoporum mexicanum PCC 7367]|uniref:DUF3007 family protein n=1 Tax=Thalassoporum mexicanum TaxID=3457544 RepID=UPI00029FA67B|nr:DUF3007 family protein [Pseudanabaena sp. PCC 7367]AFY69521.1 hypothetical protein Pse7367_1226 [Pseudanabaena sp. PCC 7367]
MRRIDAIAITLAFFALGGVAYFGLKMAGIEANSAGVWSQLVLVVGLLAWLSTYLLRVVTGNMTLDQQLDDYKKAVLQKKLAEMSPEEIAKLQAEIAAEELAEELAASEQQQAAKSDPDADQ